MSGDRNKRHSPNRASHLTALQNSKSAGIFFPTALTSVYAVLVLCLAARHASWRDEADAWLAARDLTIGQLWPWLSASGSPGLWHLLLKLLIALHLPYQSMLFLHASLAIAGVASIAFLAPFPRLFKVLLVFSYFILYEYAAVARSYVLIVLLLFLIAVVLTAKTKRYWLFGVLLLLLFNTHAQGFCTAGVIGLVVAVQMVRARAFGRDAWIGASIATIGGILAFLQLACNPHTHSPSNVRRWPVVGYALAEAFFPHVPHFTARDLHAQRHHLLICAIYIGIRLTGIAVVCSALFLMRRTRPAIVIVLACWLELQYVGVFKWYANERHAGVFFVVVVFGLWLSNGSGANRQASDSPRSVVWQRICYSVLIASLCISCISAMLWSYRDLSGDYSGAREAAAFLRNRSFAALPIAAGAGHQDEAILPYLPGREFWYSGRQNYGTYTIWDRDWQSDDLLTESDVLARARRKFLNTPHLLVIAQNPLAHPESDGYRLIFRNVHRVWGHDEENYYIYAATDSSPLRAK